MQRRKSRKQRQSQNQITTTEEPEFGTREEGGGIVICKGGQPMTIEQVVDELNKSEPAPPPKTTVKPFESQLEIWFAKRCARQAAERRAYAEKQSRMKREWRAKNAKSKPAEQPKKRGRKRKVDSAPGDGGANTGVGVCEAAEENA